MSRSDVDAVVVGAGFAGLYMLHKLRKLGLTVQVFEAGSDVGGTWYWNRYPGARVDVESIHYSYSFSPELDQEWVWPDRFPRQDSVLHYINEVANRFDLRRDIQFDTRVASAHFDEATDRWAVGTDRGDRVTARFFVLAVGALSLPKPVDFPGAEDFRGEILRTSEWPHASSGFGGDAIDFSDKRVGVIGTGSTGLQVIPEIARSADRLTVFQRTANFSIPANHRPMDEAEVAEVKSSYPELRRRNHEHDFGLSSLEYGDREALSVSAAERQRAYEDCWTAQHVSPFSLQCTFTDLLFDAAANETAAEFVRQKIREKVDDPAVAELLSPNSHPFATRRLCSDTHYFETFNSPHVDLVDARRTPIISLDRSGLKTTAQHHDLDILVLATGFDVLTGPILAMDIRGRGGQELRSIWADGPKTTFGLMVANLPNMFVINGPGAPSIFSNMIVTIEQHVEWIASCIGSVIDRGAATIEGMPETQSMWTATVAAEVEGTLFAGVDSYFNGANMPGKPNVFLPYIGGLVRYNEVVDRVAEQGYEGFRVSD